MLLSKFSVSDSARPARQAAEENEKTSMAGSVHSIKSLMSSFSSALGTGSDGCPSDAGTSPCVDATLINAALLKSRRRLVWGLPAAVIQILVDCSPEHRRKIIDAYYKLYRKLVTQMRIQTKPFSIMRASMTAVSISLADFYAREIHHTLSGFFKKNTDLVEMLSTIHRQDLIRANYAYWLRYSVSLEFSIKRNIFGYFQRLLVNLSLPRRSELPACMETAKEDAILLHKAGNDQTTFIKVFTTRSFDQLRLIFDEYKKVSGCSIETIIARYFNRKLKFGMLKLVRVARGRTGYLTEVIYEAFKNKRRTKVLRLLRIHSEHKEDLQKIEGMLARQHGTTLKKLIQSTCNGKSKKLMLALIRNATAAEGSDLLIE